jgi:hypothetical protein
MMKFYLFRNFDFDFGLEFVLLLEFLTFEMSFQLRHFSLVSFLVPIEHGFLVLEQQHMGMLTSTIVPLLSDPVVLGHQQFFF